MKRGDLVELCSKVYHTTGIYQPGIWGIVVTTEKPRAPVPGSYLVNFIGRCIMACHEEELELINEAG